jgi:hypothetical protein
VSQIRRDVDATDDSYPYVTGMGFRNRCHLIFDEFLKEQSSQISTEGQVVFVKSDFIQTFFSEILPTIQHRIKIVTHNSAIGIDNRFLEFLNHPKILKWYAQNANVYHPKLQSIPLGLANRRWVHGNVDELEEVNQEEIERDALVYMNFDINTNKGKRAEVYNLFRHQDYVFYADSKPFREYLRDLKSSKYSLSPPGAGIDCHRIWESVSVGTVPIVERCHNISFYEDAPIMIVDDWNSITEELLEEKYDSFMDVSFDNSVMSMEHWINEIGLLQDARLCKAGVQLPPGCSLE